MPCECCQLKGSRKLGFFELRKKCCKVCRRVLCHSCVILKVCLFCALKETTILEKDKLIKLAEEELVEIAEAFGVTLDSEKLMKSEMVHLILLTCKSPNILKSPPRTPNMPFLLSDCDTPMTTEAGSAKWFDDGLNINHFDEEQNHETEHINSVGKTLNLPHESNEEPTRSDLSTEKHQQNNEKPTRNTPNMLKSRKTIEALSVKELRDILRDACVNFDGILEKHELQRLVENLCDKFEMDDEDRSNIHLQPNELPKSTDFVKHDNNISFSEMKSLKIDESIDCKVNMDQNDARSLFVNSKVDQVDNQEPNNQNSERQFTKIPRNTSIGDVKFREDIQSLSSKEVKQILRAGNVDLKGNIEKHDLIELAFELWDRIHGSEHEPMNHNDSKNIVGDCNTLNNPHLFEDNELILSEKNTKEPKLISLCDITSLDFINKLSVIQLKKILKDHSIDWSGLLETWEFAYRVQLLWNEWKNSEVLFENVNLRESAWCSSADEFKMNYIKAKKRRGLYVYRNTDKDEAKQHPERLGESTAQMEQGGDEDCISFKKKKLEECKKLKEKSRKSLKIDVQATLLPPLRSLSIDDVVSPESIKEMSSAELMGILQNHPSNVTGLDESDKNDKWKLAFKVLELWNTEHSHKVQEQLEECKICMESTADCTLLDCGHVATCFQCGKSLALCPICRQEVVRVVRLFKA